MQNLQLNEAKKKKLTLEHILRKCLHIHIGEILFKLMHVETGKKPGSNLKESICLMKRKSRIHTTACLGQNNFQCRPPRV